MRKKIKVISRFQSTFPRGERHEMRKKIKVISRFQSTFPRGERQLSDQHTIKYVDFNPRSLVGNDRGLATKMTTIWDFNPRSLVGNDRKDAERIFECSDFNPRSLVGNDGVGYFTPMFTVISIHVPSWGTTVLALLQIPFTMISIHVPSWGTTV